MSNHIHSQGTIEKEQKSHELSCCPRHEGGLQVFQGSRYIVFCVYFYYMLPGISPLTLERNTNVLFIG